jgi:hypothetical protein
MKKYSTILIAFITVTAYTQKKIFLSDSTKKPVPFASVKYNKNSGIYSNENGYFLLESTSIDSLTVNALGYKIKSMSSNQISDTIFLEQVVVELDEVVISQQRKIISTKKIKTLNSDDFFSGFKTASGDEIAILLENNYGDGMVKLSSVTIPFFTKSINTKILNKSQLLKNRPFNTYYKLKFYESNNGLPGEMIINDLVIIKVNQKSNANYKVDLKSKKIIVPLSGLFVVIENIGEKDSNQDFYKTESSYNNPSDRLLLPFFMVSDKIQKKNTYYRNLFKHGDLWYNISDLNITPKSNKYNFENVGIGYELEIYE